MFCRIGRVDRRRAESFQSVAQVNMTHARNDRGTRHDPKLDSGDADPARSTVHQHPLTRPEIALGEKGIVRDRERLRESTGLHVRKRVGHR